MNTITYSDFTEKFTLFIEEIVKNNESALILKNGKPFFKILPVEENKLKGSIIFESDIISPIDEKWDANLC